MKRNESIFDENGAPYLPVRCSDLALDFDLCLSCLYGKYLFLL